MSDRSLIWSSLLRVPVTYEDGMVHLFRAVWYSFLSASASTPPLTRASRWQAPRVAQES